MASREWLESGWRAELARCNMCMGMGLVGEGGGRPVGCDPPPEAPADVRSLFGRKPCTDDAESEDATDVEEMTPVVAAAGVALLSE